MRHCTESTMTLRMVGVHVALPTLSLHPSPLQSGSLCKNRWPGCAFKSSPVFGIYTLLSTPGISQSHTCVRSVPLRATRLTFGEGYLKRVLKELLVKGSHFPSCTLRACPHQKAGTCVYWANTLVLKQKALHVQSLFHGRPRHSAISSQLGCLCAFPSGIGAQRDWPPWEAGVPAKARATIEVSQVKVVGVSPSIGKSTSKKELQVD